MEGSVSDIRPMMHLLRQCFDRGDNIDDLHQMLTDVYRNFTSIHKAVIALLENAGRKFHQGSDLPDEYRWMREDMGVCITFCRWQLNCMVNEDAGTSKTSNLLLEKIERHLLIIVKALTNYLSREELDSSLISNLQNEHINTLLTETEHVYEAAISRNEESFMPSYLLIANEFIMEFLNQVHEDLNYEDELSNTAKERNTMRGYIVLLRYYFELIADRINGEEINGFLISSQLVASKMAYYSFFSVYTITNPSWEKFASTRHRIESDIRLGCLRATSVLPYHISSVIPAMNNELLIIYVSCIQDNLSDLLKDEAFTHLTSPMTGEFTILQSGLSFRAFLLASSGPHTAGQDKLSDIRARFLALVRNVGSLTLSCFNNEINGTLTPSLRDIIEKLNLLKEESTEFTEGCVTEVRGKMDLLRQCVGHGETSDDLYQMVKYVYQNFTSIHKAVIALLENLGRKFHQGSDLVEYRWMREHVGICITFCRWQLNWIVNEDGGIDKSRALLLEKRESCLLLLIKDLTDYLSRKELDPSQILSLKLHLENLATKIEPVYLTAISRHEGSVIPRYLLIGNEFILEFLNQVHEDLHHLAAAGHKERKTMRGYLLLLKYYFEFTAGRINGEEMNGFLLSAELLASKMAYYAFFSYYTYITSLDTKFTCTRHCIESDIRLGCLRASSVLPHHISSIIPAMNSEILIILVSCIQDNLSDLLKDEALTHVTSPITEHVTIIQSGLSFLVFLLVGSGPLHTGQEKLSDIRVRFQFFLRNLGSLILSCFNNEINGTLTPLLSDFIENMNLIKEEIIEFTEGNVTEVRGKMGLLHQCVGHGETSDDLHQMIKYVYQNFTSIHKAVISLLENVERKFRQGSDLPREYSWMREHVGICITFCRWQLNWIVNEDGSMNKSSALLLEKTESRFLLLVKSLTNYLSREELNPDEIDDLRVVHISTLASEIEPVFEAAIGRNETSLMPSRLLIGNKLILEFLNQVHEDSNFEDTNSRTAEERKTMRGYMVLLRYYFEFSADIINGEEMNDFLISSQLVASKIAYYAFFSYHIDLTSWKEKFASIRHPIESDIRLGCLRATSVLPQHVSSSIPAMNNEQLIIYVFCIQNNLSDLLKDESFTDLTSPMIDQFTILQSGLSSLIFLLAGSGSLTHAGQEKLSDMRVRLQALVRNVGSLILSCFDNEMNGTLTSSLSDFIENMNLIKEASIEFTEGSVTDVSGRMGLLHRCVGHGETSDVLHQMIKYVYRNFTAIHKAVISLLENVERKFRQGSDLPEYRWMREHVGIRITFCRWQLNCMVNEDGRINKSSALLLDKIESGFLLLVKALSEYLSREELDSSLIIDLKFEHIDALLTEIEPIYQAAISINETSLSPSQLLIANEFIMEFLNQVHGDLNYKDTNSRTSEERKTMRGYVVLLKYYFEFIADRINGEEMNDFMLSSQLVASKMAYYAFLSYHTYWTSRKEKFASIRHCIESDIRLGCLRTTSVLPQHVSSSIPAMNNEQLIIYAICIQNNLSDLLKDESFTDLTSPMIDQFTILQSGLSSLIFLLAGSGSLADAGQEKLSDMRVRFQALVRNVGSLILSCINSEMNGNLTPSLSDLIENLNLIKEESIEFTEGSATEIRGKMDLLHQCVGHGETSDDMHQMLKYVYQNFTSIHKAIIALLENVGNKFHQGIDLPDEYRRMREDMGVFITFCKWQLKWMVDDDGGIDKSRTLLLEKTESRLLLIVNGLTDYLSREELDPSQINKLKFRHIANLATEIEPVYRTAIGRHEASLMHNYLLIGNEFILEFLNQVHEDLHHMAEAGLEERKTMRGYLLLLKYYFEFTMDRINGEEMTAFLISSHLVASKMAYYSFFTRYTAWVSWKEKFANTRHHIESDIRLGFLRTTSVLPQHISSTIPAMNSELLLIYVNCIQDNLLDLKDEAFTNLTSLMTKQVTILQSGLSFLVFLLADSGPLSASQERLSHIKVRFQALVRNVGSHTISCFNNGNGMITSFLSDLIENVNLIKEESIEITEDSVTEVHGKMDLLHQCIGHGETSDDLHLMLKYVYRNFTSIHKAVIALLENLRRKFHQGSDLPKEYCWMRQDMGVCITFCRWQLNCMVNEDGGINKTSALLLEKMEIFFLILIKALTDYLSREELDSSLIGNLLDEHIWNLLDEIKPVYEAAISRNFMPRYRLIANEFILEFINQVYEDLNYEDRKSKTAEERKIMRGYLVLFRYYFEFIADKINGEEMNDFLVSSHLVSSKMAYYSFFSAYTITNLNWDKKFASTRHCIESDIRLGCLRATSVLPQHIFNSIPAMNTELLINYVNCIQDNLAGLLNAEASTDLTSSMRDQLIIIQRGLSSLMILPADSWPPSAAHQGKQSDIRLRSQAMVRNFGSLIVSCFNGEIKGSITSLPSDFIENVDLIKEEIIEIMYCIVLGIPGQDYLRTHQLPFLIILLDELKELIANKSDLIKTWKNQSDAVDNNLVLFRFFIQNIKGSTRHDGSENIGELDFSEKDKPLKTLAMKIQLLRKNLQSDIDHINAEEMSELLISAQAIAFEMACHHLFRRYGEVHWWKVYVRTKDLVDSHMRIGVVRAVVRLLEGFRTHPLSDELLMGYVDCIQDNMNELVKDEASNQMKPQFERLRQDLLFISADQEKSSDFKLRFQALLRNIGSVICSCFKNQFSNLVTERSIGIADLVEKLDLLQEEIQGLQYTVILHRMRQEFPKVHLPSFFDLLLDKWKEFMECDSDTVRSKKDQCQSIHETLVLFRSFIQNFTTSSTEDEESQKLCKLITEAGYIAEYLLDSFAVKACPVSCTSRWISEFMEQIKLIKTGVMGVNCRKPIRAPTLIDVVVGFEIEMKLIRERLYGHEKQLDVVSIVGMPGSGKTTLARKVYEDPSAEKYFDVRAWCNVSQEYSKKELFLTILGSKLEVTDLMRRKSETELSLMVYKMLYRRRYFIVLDDVWGMDAFLGLKNFFPDEKANSRIMLTSRSKVIGSQTKYHSNPIELGLLSDDESWDLLERKVYPQGKCPSELCQLGKKIAQKCRGLPLAVVVVAGFLAKSVEKHELWEQVAENLSSSYLDRDSQRQWMGALELSYKFLPDLLKPLFLYLGAFPEDKEIPTDMLMWLWIADGLVQKTAIRSLEDQAGINLMDLINRNLVMVAKTSSDGRVKACHVHDLLRDMCLAKAKEVNFMDQIHAYKELPESVMYQWRLSVLLKRDTPTSLKPLIPYKYFPVVSVSPPLRTLLFFDMNDANVWGQDHNPDFSSLKLSRVIHSESTKTNIDDIVQLLHLRYIAIRTECSNIPESLSNLQNLETLMIKAASGEIVLPHTIWEMVKLRHLHVDDCATFRDAPENSSKLENLITLSTPVIDSGKAKNFCRKVPNVQKLRCILNNEHIYSNNDRNECHDLESLDKLTSLKASYFGSLKSPGQLKLPLSLRKLSLSEFRLQWSQVSIFQKLPYLEILKLRSAAVLDEFWDMGDDDEFPKLKVLKLENLNINTWNASEENFPWLEKLVLERCKQLVEIPSSLGDINSLETMEVTWCSHSAAKSAKVIEEEQTKAANELLKVHIYPPQLDSQSSS